MEIKIKFNPKDDCWTLKGTEAGRGKVFCIDIHINSVSTTEYVKCEFGGLSFYVGQGNYINQAFKTEQEMILELTRRLNGGNVAK